MRGWKVTGVWVVGGPWGVGERSKVEGCMGVRGVEER